MNGTNRTIAGAVGTARHRVGGPKGPDILVVGAGAAGLAAARTLAVLGGDSGCRVEPGPRRRGRGGEPRVPGPGARGSERTGR